MALSYNVDGLADYISKEAPALVGRAALGGKTIKYAHVQTGVKGSAPINLIDVDVTFGDGKACGWDDATTSTLSSRMLVTGAIKVNSSICDKKLLGKWGEWNVRVAAGQKTLPFEEEFTNELTKSVSTLLDKVIWRGDTRSSDTNLKRFDGIIKNAYDAQYSVDVLGQTPLNAVMKVMKSLPAEVAAKEDVIFFCSPSFLLAYRADLISSDYNQLFVQSTDANEQIIPGTTYKLVATPGLEGAEVAGGVDCQIVAMSASNLYYGTDLEGDEEKFDLWYSKDNREFRLAIEFTAGVNVAYPAEVVFGIVDRT